MKSKNKKRIIAIIGSIMLLFIISFIIVFSWFYRENNKGVKGIAHYFEMRNSSQNLPIPDQSDIAGAKKAEFYSCSETSVLTNHSFWRLELSFDDNEFNAQVSKIDECAFFHSASSKTGGMNPLFEYHDYEFRMLDCGMNYPYTMLFVGINTEERKIVYIEHEDLEHTAKNIPFEEMFDYFLFLEQGKQSIWELIKRSSEH